VRQAGILRFYRPLLKRVLAAMNAIIVGSPPMRNTAYLADHQARVHLIPYGIPLARFQTPPTAEELARVWARYGAQLTGQMLMPAAAPRRMKSHCEERSVRRSNLPVNEGDCFANCARNDWRGRFSGQAAAPDAQGSPRLLFVGRLRYYKGLDTLIRALPSIPGRLLVVGVGPMEATWKALAHATGVADRIAWLGEAADEDLPALYHLADLFVLPASHPSEAFGLVQVEAMAAGVPVVCTELGTGTSYVNQDGVTGRVVPPRDPAALAAAIRDLLADPDRLAAMSVAARGRAAAEFDAGVMIQRVLALYEETLS
jgi:glycosyltransferase involved in cell wall biosynthesis